MVVSVIDMTVSPEAVFDYTAKCTVTCQWLIMDVVGKEKPRKPCWQSGFRSLLDFTELENGGGGGSRTRVRKCSPFVSTCLVPGLKFRARYAAGTKRTWCYSARISPSDVQTPSSGQPVESALRSGLTGEDRGNGRAD